MKTKVSPAVVGLFVLGALALGLGALFSFGGVNFFSRPERFVVYFDESIHGLDLGSPVKLRGVRVGRVVDINLRYVPTANRSVVGVCCELNRNLIADEKGQLIDVSKPGQLQGLVDRGLRAQLGVIGLATGLLFVELDFVDPVVYPTKTRADLVSKYIEMPSMPSAISEFQSNLTVILNNLKQVDFNALVLEVQGLLADTRQKIKAMDTGALVAEWAQAGTAVRDLAASPELKQSLASFGAVAGKLDLILDDYVQNGPKGGDIAKSLEEVRSTVKAFNSTAVTLQKFVNAQQGLGDEAAQALFKLGEAATAVRGLADFLERNPSALLSGRKTPLVPAN